MEKHICPSCLKECEYNRTLTIDMFINENKLSSITFCSKECLDAYIACSKKGRFPEYFDIEKTKYDNDEEFLKKYKNMYWKGYRVGDVFEREVIRTNGVALKDLDISDFKDTDHDISIVSGSKINRGISGYVKKDNSWKIEKDIISIANVGTPGVCFYQKDEFVSFTDNGVVRLIGDLLLVKSKLNNNSYEFLSLFLTNLMATKFHKAFVRGIGNGNDFNREIILLPVIQDDQGNEEIFVDAMVYLYLKSMILKQDKKIQNYNNKIEELKGE